MGSEVQIILFDPNGRSPEFWQAVFEDFASDHDAEVVEVETEE